MQICTISNGTYWKDPKHTKNIVKHEINSKLERYAKSTLTSLLALLLFHFIFFSNSVYTLIKKQNQIFFIYKEIQNGAVAKSYMTNGLLIYGEIFPHFLIRKPFLIYVWLCNCSTLNFLKYEEDLIFFFYQCNVYFSRGKVLNFCYLLNNFGFRHALCLQEWKWQKKLVEEIIKFWKEIEILLIMIAYCSSCY